jgi:hypothetical protein
VGGAQKKEESNMSEESTRVCMFQGLQPDMCFRVYVCLPFLKWGFSRLLGGGAGRKGPQLRSGALISLSRSGIICF